MFFFVIQMQRVTEALWQDTGPPSTSVGGTLGEPTEPLRVSAKRMCPAAVWELLTESSASCIACVPVVPQPGGVYLCSSGAYLCDFEFNDKLVIYFH